MSEASVVRLGLLYRLWRLLPFVMDQVRATDAAKRSAPPAVDGLSTKRLRDLGFQADQVGGNIDFAKGQHYRHF
jgi:hypothetical protein